MQSPGETYPRTAYLLSLVGGILILFLSIIYALILVVVASLFAAVGFGLGAGLAIGLAVVAIVFGLIILVLAMRLKSNPQGARTTGILILVFAVISFVGGGGFYIGAILALIGGILAIVWTPPAPMAQAPWGQPVPPPGAAPGAAPAGSKFCSSCGSPNPAGTAFCAKCGAAMPP